jgi:hypothetical protein
MTRCGFGLRIVALISLPVWAAGGLPASVFFVANEQQWEGNFSFHCSAGGTEYFLTPTGMTMDCRQYEWAERTEDPFDRISDHRQRHREVTAVRGHVLMVHYENAARVEWTGVERLASYSNYFLGRDSCRWHSHVGHYPKVVAHEVWAGIDVECVVHPAGIESVYHMRLGADVSQLVIRYEGLGAPLRVDAEGNLIVETSVGRLAEKAPWAYQQINGRQVLVPVQYRILSRDTYRFACASFEPDHELVIDPLVYSTYFGGEAQDLVEAMVQDSDRNKLLGGVTHGTDFPTTPGVYQETFGGGYDAFVSKFSPEGRMLLFSTFIGGRYGDWPEDICLDSEDAVYVVGNTRGGSDWPLTGDAFDTTAEGSDEGILARLSADGSTLEFSSFFGGNGNDFPRAIRWCAMDQRAYFVGETWSSDFPITPDALFPEYIQWSNGFVCVFDPAHSSLAYSTYFPGNGQLQCYGVDAVSPMDVWIQGWCPLGGIPVTPDAFQTDYRGFTHTLFFAHLDLTGRQVAYCTYWGASGDSDMGLSVLDSQRVLLYGSTMAMDFPVTADAYDTLHVPGEYKGYVTLLEIPQTIVHSTLLGTHAGQSGYVYVYGAIAESGGSIVASGACWNGGIPTTPDAYDSTYNGLGDIFLARFSPDLSALLHATLIGGSDIDGVMSMLTDGTDSYWLAGITESCDFPTTPDAYLPSPPGYCDISFLLHYDFPDTTGGTRNIPAQEAGEVQLRVFPNPFNSTATLSFWLPKAGDVRMSVFNINGRQVMFQSERVPSGGWHTWHLDGRPLSAGSYFVRLESGTDTKVTRLLLLK